MPNNSSNFFDQPRNHSLIKLRVFEDTLKLALAIAGRISGLSEFGNSFCYIDLFAGQGKYSDGTLGSPIIALETCNRQIENSNNKLTKIDLILVEKDESNTIKLKENISDYIESDVNSKVSVEIISDEWELAIPKIKKKLSVSDWGFVFADPFSTELNISHFENAFKLFSDLKDYLILFNFQALRRLMGGDKVCQNIIEKCCGINIEDLDHSEKGFRKIQESIRNKLNFKKYATGVAITSSRKEKLLISDFFFLVLATSSFAVINGFLDTYEKIIIEIKQSQTQRSLPFEPDESNELLQKIITVLKEQSPISYEEMAMQLHNSFISWKRALQFLRYTIPNSKNINDALYRLYSEGKVRISASENLFYRRTKGKLKIVKTNSAARKIQIRYTG